MGVGIAEAALGIETAGEEVVQQPGLDLPQLGDDALGGADGLGRRASDRGDAALFGERGEKNRK